MEKVVSLFHNKKLRSRIKLFIPAGYIFQGDHIVFVTLYYQPWTIRVLQLGELIPVNRWRYADQVPQLQVLCRALGDIRSKGESTQPQYVIGTGVPNPFGHGKQIIGFAITLIMLTFTLASATKIETNSTQAKFPH